jgi:predicted GNAT family acetyltransferase
VVDIRHEPNEHRFVADLAGATAEIAYRERPNRVLDFHHTFVPRQHRGGGIASRLTAHALQYARAHDYTVVASCPFVAAFIARHREYRDLLG